MIFQKNPVGVQHLLIIRPIDASQWK